VADSSVRPAHYQPDRRTALVLTGTGVDGAYHAGALRALDEAGVRVDLVAGRGIGAAGALFAAIDGASRLWEADGLWRRRDVRRLYPWRPALRRLALGLALTATLLVVPPLVLAAGAVVYQAAVLVDAAGAGTGGWLAEQWESARLLAFSPAGLPTRLPQLVAAVLAVVVLALVVAAWQARRAAPARRDQRGGFWWAVLGTPLTAAPAIDYFVTGLWDLLRGGARLSVPSRLDLSRRYAELLADNLGQPGFRELLIVTHDLDARQDLVFALLAGDWRRPFFLRRQTTGLDRRSAEAVDLAGAARDHVLDAVAGALTLPVATEPQLIGFAPESYWRGETHRVSDRPAALLRVLEEVRSAGARQVIVVTASEELGGPHELSRRRGAPRARLGDYLASNESAAARDGLGAAADWFDALFVVRPAHNPITPLDTDGAYDERSDRVQGVGELVDRGYEDAYRQFIDPVVGASGEQMSAPDVVRSAE
jgi:hypothetical protein